MKKVRYQFEEQVLLLQTIQNMNQNESLIDPFQFLANNNIILEDYAKNWNQENQNKLSSELDRLGVDFDIKDLGKVIDINLNDVK